MTIYGIKKTMLALLLMAGSSLPALAQEGGIDPPNPPEPTYNETYQLTLTATPDGVATVTGSGKYKEGAKVSVKTSATKTEYKFRRWERNGQSVSTSANFTYTMPAEPVELTAVYEYDFNPSNPSEPTGEYSYHLYLQTNMAGGCTFNRTSGSMAVGGKAVTVKATPATGFKFLGWYEEETLLSSNASFSYTMPEHDATLMAMVEYNPTDPAIPSGSQDGVDNDPTAVTLTANSYTREYGEDNPVFGYTVSVGSITSGTPSLSCSASKTSPVGSYPIVITKGSVANGNVTLENGLLIITPAPLTVSAGNYTREEGQPNPVFTPTITGFKLGETKSVLTRQPEVSCYADEESPVGVYPVTVSGAEAQNYSFVYVDGTLTVTVKQEPLPDTPITLLPEGVTAETYYMAAHLYKWNGESNDEYDLCRPVKVAFDGQDVYFKGIFFYTDLEDVWVKGRLGNGEAVFRSGQILLKGEEKSLYLNGYNFESGNVEDILFVYNAADGSFTLNENFLILESWSQNTPSYNLYFSTMTLTKTSPNGYYVVDPPAGLVTTDYTFMASSYEKVDDEHYDFVEYQCDIKIGFQGNDVYVQGICPDLPNAWIKGTKSGSTVTFPTGQYFGSYVGLYDMFFIGKDYESDAISDLQMTYNEVDGSFDAGEYAIYISAMQDEISWYNVYYYGLFTKNNTLKGDANDDGRINGMDIVETVDCILNESYNQAADLYPVDTPDGVVNGMDLVELVDLVLSQDGSQNAPASRNGAGRNAVMALQNASIDGGLSFGIDSDEKFVMAELTVILPEGEWLKDITTDAAHKVVWKQTGTNSYHVVCYSMGNKPFYDNEKILTFHTTGGEVRVADVLLSDTDKQEHWCNVASDATGIKHAGRSSVSNEHEMFDLQGRKICGNPATVKQGIYIKNHKKVTKK